MKSSVPSHWRELKEKRGIFAGIHGTQSNLHASANSGKNAVGSGGGGTANVGGGPQSQMFICASDYVICKGVIAIARLEYGTSRLTA